MDWSGCVVTLVRHIGAQHKPGIGLLPVEHDQKRVMAELGTKKKLDCGILPDKGPALLWNPHLKEALGKSPGLCEHIEAEALRLREANQFVDPDPASYFYAGMTRPEAKK